MIKGKTYRSAASRRLTGATALIGCLVLLAAIYMFSSPKGNAPVAGIGQPSPDLEQETALAPKMVTKALATGALTAFVVKNERKPMADLLFQDESGKTRSLKEWQGRVVLLNLWATWCVPCRKEMPSLAALERRYGSKDFEVVAISVDREGAKVAGPFLDDTQSRALRLYVDPTSKSVELVTALGLPATVLIDRQGREVGRLLGPAEWTSPEALRLISVAMSETAPGS